MEVPAEHGDELILEPKQLDRLTCSKVPMDE